MQRPTFKTPFHIAALGLLALTLGLPTLAQGGAPVTNEGFEERLTKTTFYAPIPLDGVVGVDCPPQAVHATLDAAAKNPHIQHAVFMIDSESGRPLENEHIGVFRQKLTITAVVRDALAPAIFPVFFADHVYMIDSALIGGLPLHQFVGEGSEEVAAKQVGIFSSMLASAAQSRGHSDAIAYAMIDEKKKLYTWLEDGQRIFSNNKPEDTSNLTDFKQVGSALPGSTLTIDHDTAMELGFAKTIDSFDHFIVGEYLNEPNWLPANQFGRVANEIGSVIAEIEPLRDNIHELDKNSRDASGVDSPGYRQYKKALDETVRQLDMVQEALESLYNNHPERHAYFIGPNGQTLVADPEQWRKDFANARKDLGRATGTLRKITKDLSDVGGDPEILYDLNKQMETINEHLTGIGRHGNAAYWQDHAKPDLPDDIYG